MQVDAFTPGGIPMVYNRWVPRGTAYMINGNMIVVGTWRPPLRVSVASIVASQRRRRHR